MEKEKLEKILLEEEVVIEAMTWALLKLERSVISLKSQNSSFMKTSKELHFCLSQTSTYNTRNTDDLLKNSTPIFVGFALNVEKAILKYCSRNVFTFLLFISGLRRSR